MPRYVFNEEDIVYVTKHLPISTAMHLPPNDLAIVDKWMQINSPLEVVRLSPNRNSVLVEGVDPFKGGDHFFKVYLPKTVLSY